MKIVIHPYSNYKVASALLMDNGKIYAGINVENSSYGATICAERSAICAAVTDGARKIKELLLITNNDTPAPPCGMCLQVILEFSDENTTVHMANPQGIQKSVNFRELMPFQFSADKLNAANKDL